MKALLAIHSQDARLLEKHQLPPHLWIHAIRRHVGQTHVAIMAFVHVYLNIVEILTNHVDLSAQEVKNVLEIRLALETNAEIHALESVARMLNVTLLIIFQHALAYQITRVIHLVTVTISK